MLEGFFLSSGLYDVSFMDPLFIIFEWLHACFEMFLRPDWVPVYPNIDFIDCFKFLYYFLY